VSGSSDKARTPVEQHLGDRLAALVDGELKHDARDRVLAHLATCSRCKAEADAQRRLKDVFARAAPPPPSEGLLARLQGLPAGPGDGTPAPFGVFAQGFGDSGFGTAPPSGRPGGPGPETFGYVPGRQPHVSRRGSGRTGGPLADDPRSGLLPAGSAFPIHEVDRQEAERSPWRGRRFAFAAASAVSFAAIALGGALPLDGSLSPGPRGGANSPAATNGTTGIGGAAAANAARNAEYDRRRGGGPARTDGFTGRSLSGLGGAASPFYPHHRTAPAILNAHFTPPALIYPTGTAAQLAGMAEPVRAATPEPTHLVAPPQPAVPAAARP
jgi:hypothetical protein